MRHQAELGLRLGLNVCVCVHSDFDYFSRSRGGGLMPPMFFGGGGGSEDL